MAVMGLLDFVAMMFKQVAFLSVISNAGLDIPLNFMECLKNVQKVSNLLVPETVRLFVDKLPISEQNQ
jgi:hypothetical protein